MAFALTKGTICFADDFNRVILSMKRGQEYTDYINASFIDVSTAAGAALCEDGVPRRGRLADALRAQKGLIDRPPDTRATSLA